MLETPILQKPEEKMLPKPKSKTKVILWVIIFCIIIVGLVVGGFFVYKKYFSKEKEETAEEEIEEGVGEEEEFVDETANWLVYKTGDFEIKYPSKDYQEVVKKAEVKSKEAILKEYEDKQKSGGCPGHCGDLAKDKSLLEKQFEILSRVAKEEEISQDLEKEITDNFFLLSSAIDKKYYIDTIFSDNFDSAGLNLIGYDSYDAGNLSQFYYRAAFLLEDKAVLINMPLYFNQEIEKMRVRFEGTKDSCDENCTKKFNDFAQKTSEEIKNQEYSEALEERISDYDLMISTLKILK